MSDLNLTSFNPLFPMRIHQYNELFNDQNMSVMDKLNSVIDYLNQVGKLTNDVVKDWNTVYQWTMNDGLTTDVSNKIETMKANGELQDLLNTIFNALTGDMTQLQTVHKDTLVNAINDNVASLAQKTTQPEQYGCKGDGITDDTTNFTSYVNDCISKGKTMEMNGNYKITSPITINGNGKAVNFIVNGSIIASGSGIVLTNIKGGKQRIVLMGGGTSSSYGVQTSNCNGLRLSVYADAYNGIVLKNGGNKQDGTAVQYSNIHLQARNGCYQALEHGDNIPGKYQDAFGTYEYIYDADSKNGIVFQNSNDITIEHIENHFFDSTHSKDSITFNTCGAIHGNVIAIGGLARNLLTFNGSHAVINDLYVVNEDAGNSLPLTTVGVYATNNCQVVIDKIVDGGCVKVLNISDTNSSMLYVVKYGYTTIGNASQQMINLNGVNLGLSYWFSYASNGNRDFYENVTFKGKTVGVAQSQYNQASSALSPTASPYYYTNNNAYPVQVSVQGGTVTSISLAKHNDGSYTNIGLTQGIVYMSPTDNLQIVYTAAPTMRVFPL